MAYARLVKRKANERVADPQQNLSDLNKILPKPVEAVS
jgi:hypothetical protein